MWLRLYLGLEEAGVDVVLANPKKTKAIAKAKLKNVKVEAHALADQLGANLIAPCYVLSEPIKELRGLTQDKPNERHDVSKEPDSDKY